MVDAAGSSVSFPRTEKMMSLAEMKQARISTFSEALDGELANTPKEVPEFMRENHEVFEKHKALWAEKGPDYEPTREERYALLLDMNGITPPTEEEAREQVNWQRSIPLDVIFRKDGEVVGSLNSEGWGMALKGLNYPPGLTASSLSVAEQIERIKELNPGVEVLDFTEWEIKPTEGQLHDTLWGTNPDYIHCEKWRDPNWEPDVLFDDEGNLLFGPDGASQEAAAEEQFSTIVERRLSRMNSANLNVLRDLQNLV